MRSVFPVTIRDWATGYELTTKIRFLSRRLGGPCEYRTGLLIPLDGCHGALLDEAMDRIHERLDRLVDLLDVRRRRTT